jgi:hypothetical protein
MCLQLHACLGSHSNGVSASQAPESILSPNLHIATCRLLTQELPRGPAAWESEWVMERCDIVLEEDFPALQHEHSLHLKWPLTTAVAAIACLLETTYLRMPMLSSIKGTCSVSIPSVSMLHHPCSNCRFFLEPKNHVAGVGRDSPHITWMKSCVVLDRALSLHKAVNPDWDVRRQRWKRTRMPGENADPHAGSSKRPCLAGAGQHYTQQVAGMCARGSSERRVPVKELVAGCNQLLHMHARGQQDAVWWLDAIRQVGDDHIKMLDYCKPVIFHRCRLQKFLVSSALSVQVLARQGKSEASSYCLVNITTDEGEYAEVPAFVSYFMLVQWTDASATVDRVARVNIIDLSEQNQDECAKDNRAFGSRVFRFDPTTDIKPQHDRWIDVSDILRPFMLIKSKPPFPLWRLVQYEDSLLGGATGAEND